VSRRRGDRLGMQITCSIAKRTVDGWRRYRRLASRDGSAVEMGNESTLGSNDPVEVEI